MVSDGDLDADDLLNKYNVVLDTSGQCRRRIAIISRKAIGSQSELSECLCLCHQIGHAPCGTVSTKKSYKRCHPRPHRFTEFQRRNLCYEASFSSSAAYMHMLVYISGYCGHAFPICDLQVLKSARILSAIFSILWPAVSISLFFHWPSRKTFTFFIKWITCFPPVSPTVRTKDKLLWKRAL